MYFLYGHYFIFYYKSIKTRDTIFKYFLTYVLCNCYNIILINTLTAIPTTVRDI